MLASCPAMHKADERWTDHQGRGPWDCPQGVQPLYNPVRYPIAKARGFPALTFPRGEDSESRASYEAALHAALAWPLLTKLCFGALHGVS